MTAQTYTVAFEGVEAQLVSIQCAVLPGLPGFAIVGLPDKAVSEARERVRAALAAMGLALPAKKITVNLSPADLPKVGSHFDLPIAIAVLAAMDVIPKDEAARQVSLGEIALDGRLVATPGALPTALAAAEADCGLVCPEACGAEAAWVSATPVVAAARLIDVVNHLSGKVALPLAKPGEATLEAPSLDLSAVKGQERARRALEIAAAGRHHLLMIGPPGAGKSMLAQRLPGILPPLSAKEALETSMIQSLAGTLERGCVSRTRPFQSPHHTASKAAIIGGGKGAQPGEISLAHNGVLFLDELPEFGRDVLDTLRQPIEAGEVMVSRANAHVRYPCRFLLVAAANPCRCGYLADASRACSRAPLCGEDYLGRISGPLMDRFDLRIEVPPVDLRELATSPQGEASSTVAARVAAARNRQDARHAELPDVRANADLSGDHLTRMADLTPEADGLLLRAADRFGLSARGYHRIIKVARTIADLAGSTRTERTHVAEAIAYRLAQSDVAPSPPAQSGGSRRPTHAAAQSARH